MAKQLLQARFYKCNVTRNNDKRSKRFLKNPKLPSLEAIQKPFGNLFIVNKETNTM
jgi:hypothetical protein